jgi:rhodanese-related sulfurtransferase
VSKIILACYLAVIGFLAGVYINPLRPDIRSLEPAQFQQAINSGKYTLIDVRTADEYSTGHIKSAIQNDYYQTQKFSDFLDSLDKKAKYLIYCRTGRRSANVLKLMQSKEFTNVADLAGGITAWSSAGFPIEK